MARNKLFVMNAILCSCVLMVMCFASVPTYADDTIKIAFISPFSGTWGALGEQDKKHFDLLLDDINSKGGPLGKQLEIVYYDNKNAPTESVIQLKRAIADGINIIIQTHSSGATNALNEAIRKHNARNPDKKVLFLVFDTTDPQLNNEKCNFWMFHFGHNADQRIGGLCQYFAKDQSIKKVYLINMDYSHGRGCSAASRRELKRLRPDIEIVGDTLHAVGKIKDFTPYINNIRASGADAVLTGDWGTDLNLLIKASHNEGLKIKWATIYAGVLGAPSALGKAGEGTLQITKWHLNYNDGDNETTKFALRYREKYGSDMYYQGINTMIGMLCAAIEKYKSTDPICMAYALEGMTWKIPTGTFLMRAEDHQAVAPQIVSEFSKDVKYKRENTDFGWKTVAVIPPIDIPTIAKMKRPDRPAKCK